MNLVSIITPTYNHEKYIAECIDSVLVQTYSHWEMIIIDDGSTDGTAEIIAQYKDPRIKYVRQENKGIWRLGETYNKGLSMAKGDFIAILEGDDYWPHYKLKTQVEDFLNSDIILSYGSTATIFDNYAEIIPSSQCNLTNKAKNNSPLGAAAIAMMNRRFLTFTFPVSVMIRRSALTRIGGFLQPSYLPLVDYPTFLNLAIEGGFAFHSEVLGFWRRHELSTTKNKHLQITNGVEKYINFFLKEKGAYFNQEEKADILWSWQDFNSLRWSLLGRSLLVEREWKDARKAFKKGLNYNSSFFRVTILKIGVLLSYLHLNLEFLLHGIGLGTVNDILEKIGDPIVSKEMLSDVSF